MLEDYGVPRNHRQTLAQNSQRKWIQVVKQFLKLDNVEMAYEKNMTEEAVGRGISKEERTGKNFKHW